MDDYEYNEKAVKKKLIKEGVPETLAILRKHLIEIVLMLHRWSVFYMIMLSKVERDLVRDAAVTGLHFR